MAGLIRSQSLQRGGGEIMHGGHAWSGGVSVCVAFSCSRDMLEGVGVERLEIGDVGRRCMAARGAGRNAMLQLQGCFGRGAVVAAVRQGLETWEEVIARRALPDGMMTRATSA